MRYQVIATSLLLLVSACTPIKDTSMKKQLLISAKCKGSERRGNDPVPFEGKDLLLDISIANPQNTEVGFPLTYVQKCGPIIKLIDSRTKAEAYLKGNLADNALQKQFTIIRSGQSLLLEWVITSGELEQFGGTHVDVSAEITVKTGIQVGGNLVDFQGSDTLRIVRRTNP